jgi:Apea-like HEPN
MKYHFVAKMNFMSLDTTLNKGKLIGGTSRISNGAENFRRLFDNRYFRDYVGGYHFHEFEDSVYIYAIGDFEELKAKFDKEYNLMEYAFFLLRNAQYFVNCLWLVKDNSIYVRDAFLDVYPDGNPAQGNIQYASVSAINSNTSGDVVETSFSMDELKTAISYFTPTETFEGIEDGGKFPFKNPLTKEAGRIGRAVYFCIGARSISSLPMKILNYCTVLECLFTSDSFEVTHKVSERLAFLLGKDSIERNYYYQLVRDAYRIRSKAVHGQFIKTQLEDMQRISKGLDESIRRIFINYYQNPNEYEVFSIANNEKFEEWFNNLILA